ncbi:hypothetical protein EW026_g3378 [Hermanssonia centrifuga]|uniref:Uncharacterized protein n=1 Tax=Hermanssonia centrifuga TaxID=98765 RepID=A0A4V3XAP0_9APHY|nr:hypothetical protein EW026_g3378 [Hermanssonia centrifuga]
MPRTHSKAPANKASARRAGQSADKPARRLIPVPDGEAGRRPPRGYNLQEAMGLGGKDKKYYRYLCIQEHAFFAHFEQGWPVYVILKQYYSNSAAASKQNEERDRAASVVSSEDASGDEDVSSHKHKRGTIDNTRDSADEGGNHWKIPESSEEEEDVPGKVTPPVKDRMYKRLPLKKKTVTIVSPVASPERTSKRKGTMVAKSHVMPRPAYKKRGGDQRVDSKGKQRARTPEDHSHTAEGLDDDIRFASTPQSTNNYEVYMLTTPELRYSPPVARSLSPSLPFLTSPIVQATNSAIGDIISAARTSANELLGIPGFASPRSNAMSALSPLTSQGSRMNVPETCPALACEDPFPANPSEELLTLCRNPPQFHKNRPMHERRMVLFEHYDRICMQISLELRPPTLVYPMSMNLTAIADRLHLLARPLAGVLKLGSQGFIFKKLQAYADTALKHFNLWPMASRKESDRPAFMMEDLNIASRGNNWNVYVQDLGKPG